MNPPPARPTEAARPTGPPRPADHPRPADRRLSWVARRLLLGAGQAAAVPVLVFVLTEALPGDAAVALAGDDPSPARIAAIRAELGLDRPAAQRFLDWTGELAHGGLGRSYAGGRPVAELLADALAPTLLLAGLTLVLIVPLAVGLGLLAARREGGPLDRTIGVLALAVYAVPEFALGVLLVAVVALEPGRLPPTAVGGVWQQPAVLVLPVLVLLARPVCAVARLVRAGLVEALAAPYAVHARRCGLSERRVRLGHALPNALGPAVQQLARTADWLLCGVVVTEALFVIPGLGTVLLDAVAARDVPVVQGLAVLFGLFAVLLNLGADLATRRLAPRTEAVA